MKDREYYACYEGSIDMSKVLVCPIATRREEPRNRDLSRGFSPIQLHKVGLPSLNVDQLAVWIQCSMYVDLFALELLGGVLIVNVVRCPTFVLQYVLIARFRHGTGKGLPGSFLFGLRLSVGWLS